MEPFRPIRRALFSVYDKNEILKFAKSLFKKGIEIISTGKTAKFLINAGIEIIDISKYTGFPEMMEGRIKTLHLKLYGGILGRRGKDDDVMKLHNMPPIDIVVVNLYPFADTIKNPNCNIKDAFKNIDIGGNSIIRAAAKNYNDVAIVIDNKDFDLIIKEMDNNKNSLSLSTRFNLAIKAFEYTASYDDVISTYLNKLVNFYNKNTNKICNNFPQTLNLNFTKKQDLRYGENNHQQASFYLEKNSKETSIATSKQIQGKMLSYNNVVDADTAFECVKLFNNPACVIVKHSNPCGVSESDNIYNAYNNALKADPISAFGGIIAFNRKLDKLTSELIIKHKFIEVIIAPSIDNNAIQIFLKKQKIRLLICGELNNYINNNLNYKSINGGLLVQDCDLFKIKDIDLSVVTKRQPTENELKSALFSWKIVRFVKSNAVVYAKNNITIAIGSGQTSRVYSVKLANFKAKSENLETNGCVMASDAFFPFRDCIDIAANIGISCIIQPGGSIKDNDIIDAANEYNIAMIFTKIRYLRH